MNQIKFRIVLIDLLTRLHELYNPQIPNLPTVGGIKAPKI